MKDGVSGLEGIGLVVARGDVPRHVLLVDAGNHLFKVSQNTSKHVFFAAKNKLPSNFFGGGFLPEM